MQVVKWISPVITNIKSRIGYWNVKVRNTEGLEWFTQLFRKD
jgi:hypothetical protein